MFIVIEIQKTDQIATLVTAYETRNEAEAKYHSILAAAALSSVPVHAAAMMSEEGYPIKNDVFKHEAQEQDDGK